MGSENPTWESDCGSVKLWLGDCFDVMQTWPAKTEAAIVTDPPYGISANRQTLGNGKKEFFRGDDWDDERPDVAPLLGFGGDVVIWGGNYFADSLPVTNDWLCWHKKISNAENRPYSRHYRCVSFSEFELAWSNLGTNCRIISHHWSGEVKQHPTQKPQRVMSWCVGLTTGDTVADPFMGSGTIGVSAVRLGRSFWGVEREPAYFEIAKRRIHDELDRADFLEPHRIRDRQAELFGDENHANEEAPHDG